jgi:hypothetical protein
MKNSNDIIGNRTQDLPTCIVNMEPKSQRFRNLTSEAGIESFPLKTTGPLLVSHLKTIRDNSSIRRPQRKAAYKIASRPHN